MVFSSTLFLLYYFPIFLIVYFCVKRKHSNLVALFGSVIFYVWGGKFFSILLGVTLIMDFYIVDRVSKSSGSEKKLLFWLSICLNLGMLAYFKYANFFIDNLTRFFDADVSGWVKIALPIGISFFTFQKMSYTIDVYRGTHKSLQSLRDYVLYIILFPQLIAGPIVRYNEIAEDLINREKNETIDNKILGLFRFAIGLGKKILIANVLGATADNIFETNSLELSLFQSWLGAVLYAFQIYFDFSGYSDMAIGIGRILGFNFPENFNFPYISKNITEFWQRWHITLGRWMRDYLYIPLGGNKVAMGRMYLNLCVVFLLSGLWHGASWNFVFWGVFHGVFLILDKLFFIKLTNMLGRFPSVLITFVITLIGWVIFRVENLDLMGEYFRAMLGFGDGTAIIEIDFKTWSILLIAILFSFGSIFTKIEILFFRTLEIQYLNIRQSIIYALSSFVLISLCLAYIAGSSFNPFIYFRF